MTSLSLDSLFAALVRLARSSNSTTTTMYVSGKRLAQFKVMADGLRPVVVPPPSTPLPIRPMFVHRLALFSLPGVFLEAHPSSWR